MFLRGAVLLSLALVPIAAHAAERPDLAACEAGFAAAPDSEESSSCFFEASKDPEVTPAATARLEKLLAQNPGHPWLSLYLGHLKTADQEQAAALYRAAAAKFAILREARGEVLARANLQRMLTSLGKLEEAGAEAERAVEVAEASKDPELIARSKIVLARYLFYQGQDLERSYLLLRNAQEVAFPDGAYFLQRDSLHWLGNVSLEMGRFQEARDYFRREAELASANDDRYAEAVARYSLARAFLDESAQMPREGYRAEAIELARQALAVAEAAQHRSVASKADWLLGLLLNGPEARAYLDRCLEAADALRERSYCLNALGRHLSGTDPQAAGEAIREALDLAQQADDPWSMAYSWRERMRVSWAAKHPEQAVADSYAALDAIEALRDLQVGYGQAEMFATWSEDYSWFAGKLLQAEMLDGAFDVMERMRGRALLDALTAARVAPALTEAAKPLQSRRAALLGEISRVQRRLLTPDLPTAERQAARLELERLELEEAGLRNRLEQADPARSALRASSFSSLAAVRKALAPDEALLSFQIAPEEDLFGGFGGGSWLLAVTRQGNRVYRLQRDRVALRPAVGLFTGLFERRDGSEAGPAAGLYNLLLRDALRDLPQGVRRLVLIPDDALHQLPFAALRPAPEAAPLAARYRLTIVPSATLGLHGRNDRPLPAPEPLLALADPVMPGAGARRPVRPAAERAVMFADPIQLG
ncbi:MAG TPA: CHAT domain-containing protein, partial [Thermoanaerobaculia bacterium]